MTRDDKLKALDAAITQIEKSYGKGSRRFLPARLAWIWPLDWGEYPRGG